MLRKGFFIVAAFAALALASETEDGEQKKRGAGKANALNSIPTGPQKSDYTYNIYSQNPSTQSSASQSYPGQVSNSFYPNQVASQYYAPSNSEPSTSNSLHTQVAPQTQTKSTQSQFVPINFVPSPGYQSKYQIVSPKQSGNLQLAFVQQPSIQPSPLYQYPHSIFPSHANQITPQSAILSSQGHFNFGPSYQPLSLGGAFIGQPSMIVLPQSHGSLYNNLVYPNPTQSFYNYYPSTSQAKYSYSSAPTLSQSNDYEKAQVSVPQTIKEDNLNVQNNEYINTSDPNSGYKSAFTSRSAYSKL